MRCPACGHSPNRADAKFCSRCGQRLSKIRTPSRKVDEAPEIERSMHGPEGGLLLCRARCTKTKKPFAIRFERFMDGIWYARSSWEIDEKRVNAEVFSAASIIGKFKKHKDYPGCPYCGNSLFRTCFTCNSGLGCLAYLSPTYECPWCGERSAPRWGPPSKRAIRIPGAKD